MKNIATLGVKGQFNIKVFDKDGNLKSDTGWRNNIITNAGKAQLALLAGDASATPFTYLALGSSSTAVAATDTTMTTEYVAFGLSRSAATVSRVTTTVTNDTLQLYKEFTATDTKTIEEVGVFNASSAGTMLCHALTGAIAVVNTDKVQETYQIKFA